MHILAILLLVPFINAECPEGWWKAGEACYFTSHLPLSWYAAQEVLAVGFNFIEKKIEC